MRSIIPCCVLLLALLSVMVSGNLCWAYGLGDNVLGAPGEYMEMNPFTGRSLLLGVKAFDVARSRDGGILAVSLEDVSEENQTHEYVSMARMTPGSANWSYSRVCELSLPWATPVTRPRATSIAFLEDSEGVCWIALASREDAPWVPGDNPANMSIWLLRSDDGGGDWSAPWRIPFQYVKGGDSWGFFDLSFLEDPCEGLWIVFNYVYYYRGNRLTLYVKSYDRGLTWSAPERFGTDGLWLDYGSSGNPDGYTGFYQSFSPEGNGRLGLLYVRDPYLGYGQVWQATSTDCGRTWQPPERLLPGLGSVPQCRLFEESIGGSGGGSRLWLFWVSSGDCYLCYSDDSGGSWQPFGSFEYPEGGAQYRFSQGTPKLSGSPGDGVLLFWADDGGQLLYAPIPEKFPLTVISLVLVVGWRASPTFLRAARRSERGRKGRLRAADTRETAGIGTRGGEDDRWHGHRQHGCERQSSVGGAAGC